MRWGRTYATIVEAYVNGSVIACPSKKSADEIRAMAKRYGLPVQTASPGPPISTPSGKIKMWVVNQ